MYSSFERDDIEIKEASCHSHDGTIASTRRSAERRRRRSLISLPPVPLRGHSQGYPSNPRNYFKNSFPKRLPPGSAVASRPTAFELHPSSLYPGEKRRARACAFLIIYEAARHPTRAEFFTVSLMPVYIHSAYMTTARDSLIMERVTQKGTAYLHLHAR